MRYRPTNRPTVQARAESFVGTTTLQEQKEWTRAYFGPVTRGNQPPPVQIYDRIV